MLVKVLVLVSALSTMVLQFQLCLYAKNKVGYATVIHQHISRYANVMFCSQPCTYMHNAKQLFTATDELSPNYRS